MGDYQPATGGVRVTPEGLLAAAASCDATAASVDAGLMQLKTYVGSMEAWWGGIAANTFMDLMTRYQMNSQKMHEVLTEIAQRLRTSAANYGENERANVANSESVLQNLPAVNLG